MLIKEKMASPITRGYGKVSSSVNSPAVTADTTFMMASVSKVFAGSAVSVLLDKKIIGSLDDDICNVIPSSWQRSACRNPKFPNTPVTWRMLVTHRSSLRVDVPTVRNKFRHVVSPGYGPSGGYEHSTPAAGNPTCPLEDVVGFFRDFLTDKETETSVGSDFVTKYGKPINWYIAGEDDGGAWLPDEPGSTSEYSNLGTGYLAALVELATGQAFPEFCRKNLFEPLGMVKTAWFRRNLPAGTLEAVPVRRHFLRYSDIGHYCFIDYASGELRSSVVDMARWCQSMLSYGAPTLWNETIGKQAFACQERETDGTTQPSPCEFGVNWIRLDNARKGDVDEDWLLAYKDYDWTDGVSHNGGEAGAQSQILVLPAAKVFAVVLTNTDGNDEMAAEKIAAALVPASMGQRPDGKCFSRRIICLFSQKLCNQS